MTIDYMRWRHVFKLDPARELSDEALERICMSGTDAIIVGGSTDVTFDNTVDLLSRVRRYAVACALEVSAEEAVVPGFDLYFVPVVLNTDNGGWITGRQHAALRDYVSLLDWDTIVAEGYVILNVESTAGQLTGAKPVRDVKDVLAYAALGDRLFRLPIVYMEYSGTFGDMDWVRGAADQLVQARLFYGGGIDGAAKAAEAASAAHTVVVGNAVYDDLAGALETVDAVKRTPFGAANKE